MRLIKCAYFMMRAKNASRRSNDFFLKATLKAVLRATRRSCVATMRFQNTLSTPAYQAYTLAQTSDICALNTSISSSRRSVSSSTNPFVPNVSHEYSRPIGNKVLPACLRRRIRRIANKLRVLRLIRLMVPGSGIATMRIPVSTLAAPRTRLGSVTRIPLCRKVLFKWYAPPRRTIS